MPRNCWSGISGGERIRAFSKGLKLLRALLGSGYIGIGDTERLVVEGIPIQLSGNAAGGRLLLFSTGFGGRPSDYEPVVTSFEQRYLVARVGHPGFGRGAIVGALLKFFWLKLTARKSSRDAALVIRRRLHRESQRKKRLTQLECVRKGLVARYPDFQLSVAGHSFGTDTALLLARRENLENLYLFSPHPPGYLLEKSTYKELRCGKLWVVTGTRDFTRDGTGPAERLKVGELVPKHQLGGVHCLEGVGHMDFALPELGPTDLGAQLRVALE